ncbi:hypothetical protein [Candidatus Reidiella endopervernicosa]|uniref:hypothetical protein n=1 Tax=Candidatus Reidiella endopervernicosa TaxID=2738883 RepID=UPI001F3FD850|nr:hypothetical protein [Candidatus Reidiella endopervernicosa]
MGSLVPVGDVDALALAIEEALYAPVDQISLKKRAAEFTPKKAAAEYMNLLDIS